MVGLLLLVLILGLVAFFAVTIGFVVAFVMLFLSGLIGFSADYAVPGRIPFGYLGAILAGLLGMWLGGLIPIGPVLEGYGFYILPAIVAAILVATIANFAAKRALNRDA
ncbi:MAG: GlsB/YeaQ/YmgE family stress response membrane protein [Chloroflexi bacterium]|nr:GlsB/YeaQ/YmgE family stress response membrane protein [Chloroflexota bacterium]